MFLDKNTLKYGAINISLTAAGLQHKKSGKQVPNLIR